uniref:Uncharacterized protein n=1 Tax=Arundo donax TaxID=35708 RepID=A0A0A8ZQX0_ARUDO
MWNLLNLCPFGPTNLINHGLMCRVCLRGFLPPVLPAICIELFSWLCTAG